MIILTEITIDADLTYHAVVVNHRVVLNQGPSDERPYETVESCARALSRALGLKVRRLDLTYEDLCNLSGSLTWRDKRPWEWQDVVNALTHLAGRAELPDPHPAAAEEFGRALDAFGRAVACSQDHAEKRNACLSLFRKQAIDADAVLCAERAKRQADQPLLNLVRQIGLNGLATLQAALHAYYEDGLGEPLNRSEVVHALASGAPEDRLTSLTQNEVQQMSAHLMRLRVAALENGLWPNFRMAIPLRPLPAEEDDIETEFESPAHH